MEFLRVFDASVGVQGTNILSFVGVGASQPHYMSFLHNMKFVYCPPHCTSMISSMRTGYSWMLKRMLTRYCAAVDNVLVTWCFQY
jgi:hypothetical protein